MSWKLRKRDTPQSTAHMKLMDMVTMARLPKTMAPMDTATTANMTIMVTKATDLTGKPINQLPQLEGKSINQ